MISLTIFIISIVLNSIITYLIVFTSYKNRIKKDLCPFHKACLNYNEIETKEAANRVIKLLIENVKQENEYKKILKNFVEKLSSLNNQTTTITKTTNIT